MKRLTRYRRKVIKNWPGLLVAVATIGLLNFKIYQLNPGLAAAESALPTVKASLSALWNQPVEAPLHLSRLAVAAVSQSTGIALSRLPSMLLGFALVCLCYWLIKKWYGYRLALFGIVLLITAPWFLHVSRLATNDIVYPLAMVVVMALAAAWHSKQWSRGLLYISAVSLAGLLYVPGAIWLVLGVAWFERKVIFANLRARKAQAASAAFVGLIFTVPLIHALVNNWHSYRSYIGLPAVFPAPLDYLQNFVQSWQYLFIGGYDDPVHNLGQLPITNALIALSFLVGVSLYAKHAKAIRTKQLLALWFIATALVAFHGSVSYAIVMPIVLVLAVGGIGYLLHLWLKTFPRNPYARTFGIGLLAIVVAFAVAYNLRNYFIAWPHSQAVRSTFTRQL